jgi:CHAD domain-containing protein
MKPHAGRDVGRYVGELAGRLDELVPSVVAGVPDAAHQMRTTARRASACLMTFGHAMGVADSVDLRRELAWLTAALGSFRDAEVLATRLPGEHEVPVRVEQALSQTLAQATTDLRSALDSRRFAAVPVALAAVGATAKSRPRRRELRRAVRRGWRRTHRRHAAYLAASDEHHRDELLHEVRKSLRRLRYACDALGTSCGSRVAAGAAEAKAVQEVLGEHHDAVVSLSLLRGLAVAEHDPARLAAYALLFDVETTARDRALARFEAAWPRLEPHFRRH